MAVHRLSRIQMARTRQGYSLEEAAERLLVSPARLRELEANIGVASELEVKDLAVFYGETADAIRGVETPLEALAKSPFAAVREVGVLFGSLRLQFATHDAEYPITREAADRIKSELADLDVQQEGEAGWLSTSTLNNKLLFVSLKSTLHIGIVDDNDSAAPPHAHPEVYNELEDWDSREKAPGPVVLRACEYLFELYGQEEVVHATNHVRLLREDGQVDWQMLLNGDDSLGLYGLELVADSPRKPNRFVRIGSDTDDYGRYYNLSRYDLIEVPLNRYMRVNASDD